MNNLIFFLNWILNWMVFYRYSMFEWIIKIYRPGYLLSICQESEASLSTNSHLNHLQPISLGSKRPVWRHKCASHLCNIGKYILIELCVSNLYLIDLMLIFCHAIWMFSTFSVTKVTAVSLTIDLRVKWKPCRRRPWIIHRFKYKGVEW